MTPKVFQGEGYDYAAREPRVDLQNRESIIRWLVWNDSNGCYTDHDCAVEEIEPLTLETARDAILRALASATGEEDWALMPAQPERQVAAQPERDRLTFTDMRATELHGERHWLLAMTDRDALDGEEPDVYVMTAADLQVLIGQATKALARRLRPDADAVDAADVLHARLAAMRDV